jgi:hypothetical protein
MALFLKAGFSWIEDMTQKTSRPTLRPMAIGIATAFLAASSILLYAAQVAPRNVSGYGVTWSEEQAALN